MKPVLSGNKLDDALLCVSVLPNCFMRVHWKGKTKSAFIDPSQEIMV
jgi:hypothetical protein